MKTNIIYHAHCIDGLAAAAVAMHYAKNNNKEFNFIPMVAGLTPDIVLNMKNEKLIFIDVAPRYTEYDKLLAGNNQVLIRDHHVTAKNDFHGNMDDLVVFDMNKSGATLAADLFGVPDEFKDVLSLIEDKDLNTNKFKTSTWVFYALCDELNKIDDSNTKIPLMLNRFNQLDDLIAKGKALDYENDTYIENSIASGEKRKFGEMQSFVVRVPTFKLCSEIGNRVLQEQPDVLFTLLIYPNENGFNASLRSRPDFKVSTLAKLFNGGGHAQASGFRFKDFDEVDKLLSNYKQE